MKYAIPLGAILLVGIALGVHRLQTPVTVPVRTRPIGEAVCQEGSVTEGSDRESSRVATAGFSVQAGVAKAPISGSDRGPNGKPEWKKLLVTLDRSVGLTPAQAASLESLLLERDQEVRQYQESVRTLGVIDLQDYDWRMGLMKQAWYRRMDALLDREQHERFLALLAKGFLNEGLEFTVEPGMTVLD